MQLQILRSRVCKLAVLTWVQAYTWPIINEFTLIYLIFSCIFTYVFSKLPEGKLSPCDAIWETWLLWGPEIQKGSKKEQYLLGSLGPGSRTQRWNKQLWCLTLPVDACWMSQWIVVVLNWNYGFLWIFLWIAMDYASAVMRPLRLFKSVKYKLSLRSRTWLSQVCRAIESAKLWTQVLAMLWAFPAFSDKPWSTIIDMCPHEPTI